MNTRTLRHLIREYEIKYDLPGSSSSNSAKDPNEGSRDKLKTALKTLLGAYLITKSLVFFNEQRNAIFTFGSIVKAAVVAAVTDALPESVEARVISRILLEAAETYKTRYGEIDSAEIGKLLKSNVDKISAKKNYLTTIPAIIDASIMSKFAIILDELSTSLSKLNAAVDAADKQVFPNSFSSFSPQPAGIGDDFNDIDTKELEIANSAMTDSCAVAYYNSIHNQIESYLSALGELASNDTSINKDAVKDHVKKILATYDDKIDDRASKILTGDPT